MANAARKKLRMLPGKVAAKDPATGAEVVAPIAGEAPPAPAAPPVVVDGPPKPSVSGGIVLGPLDDFQTEALGRQREREAGQDNAIAQIKQELQKAHAAKGRDGGAFYAKLAAALAARASLPDAIQAGCAIEAVGHGGKIYLEVLPPAAKP